MTNGPAGVSDLASKVRTRRQALNALDTKEIDSLSESWGTTFDLFGIDQTDPVVGATVLLTSKMLTHRVATLTEYGHDTAGLQPALYVTGEAALVGLDLLDGAKPLPQRPGRFHRWCAVVAAIALVVSAVTALRAARVAADVRVAKVTISSPAEAAEWAKSFRSEDSPVAIVVTELVTK